MWWQCRDDFSFPSHVQSFPPNCRMNLICKIMLRHHRHHDIEINENFSKFLFVTYVKCNSELLRIGLIYREECHSHVPLSGQYVTQSMSWTFNKIKLFGFNNWQYFIYHVSYFFREMTGGNKDISWGRKDAVLVWLSQVLKLSFSLMVITCNW